MKNNIYIFDLDGTLIDSMPYFKRAMLSIADDEGLEYDENLIKILTPLGYIGGAEYYIKNYGIKATVDELCKKVQSRLYSAYAEKIPLKNGVLDYLKKLNAEQNRLFVLTASPHSVTDVCLKHNGVYDLFEKVWSVEDFALTKTTPEIFHRVADVIGCREGDVNYFDDSLIALENARAAGFITYGVVDSQSERDIKRLNDGLCHFVVADFSDLI